jgi:methyl-accepting chemotaxis protein
MDKARDLTLSYFDGVNTMMLTGTMAQQESLREKYLEMPGVREIRLVHAPGTLDGVSSRTVKPEGEHEERGVKGERVAVLDEDEQGRFVTVVTPLPASTNHHGTNCLDCHQVPEGTILGAVRTTYSLDELDAEFRQSALTVAMVNLVLSVIGIGMVVLLLRRIVIQPLLKIRETMLVVERDADLTRRIHLASKDEVGALAQAINRMLEKFSGSLGSVAATSKRLSTAAERVASVSVLTADAAGEQLREAGATARSLDDLKRIAGEAGESAGRTAAASVEADRDAVRSTRTTREAIQGIQTLVDEIRQAAEVIEALDRRSQEVSNVLEVIKGIAEQTNLLALNAAIEAARAGEMGRGFAVVADEVRKLANMSHQSTGSIEEIVLHLREEARRAVAAMNEAREAATRHSGELESAALGLDQIVVRVADIRDLNAHVAESVRDQAGLTEGVDQRVGNIGRIAEQTASEAVATRKVSEELVELAREMNELVGRFRLGD